MIISKGMYDHPLRDYFYGRGVDFPVFKGRKNYQRGRGYPVRIQTRQSGGFGFLGRTLARYIPKILSSAAGKAIKNTAKSIGKEVGKRALKRGIEEMGDVIARKKTLKQAGKDLLKSTARDAQQQVVKKMTGRGTGVRKARIRKKRNNDVFSTL